MQTYSVSEFSALVEQSLKKQFSLPIRIEGEISNFKASANGHWYFTLKDDTSQIQAVMFRGANSSVHPRPRDGDTVLAVGEVAFYKARGQCQIICNALTPRGVGAILARLEALKQKCTAEGLFSAERKQSMPPLPRTIALLTSRNAAAFEDVKRTFHNYGVHAHVHVFHCAVQGENAAPEICTQLHRAQHYTPTPDVIMISRGGGSLEDLLAFSDESLVRAIASCKIPVISGVGHEVDTPLCELAADIRAHTPTDAAEMICKTILKTTETVTAFKNDALRMFKELVEEKRYVLNQFAPKTLVPSFFDKTRAMRQTIDAYAERVRFTTINACRSTLTTVQTMRERLQASSPSAIISRGYSLIYNNDKTKLMTSAKELYLAMPVTLVLKDGEKPATIQ